MLDTHGPAGNHGPMNAEDPPLGWTTAAAVLAGGLGVADVVYGAIAPRAAPFGVTLLLTAAFVSYCGLGIVIVRRAGGHRIGWLLLGVGLFFLAGGACENAAKAFVGHGGDWVTAWLSWVDSWAWTAALGLIAGVILVFPSGRLPSRRWRPVAAAIAAGTGIQVLEAALRPGRLDGGAHLANPIGVTATSGLLSTLVPVAGPVLAVAVLLSVAGLVIRWRGATDVERQQLRWLMVAVAMTLLSVVLVPLGAAVHLPLASLTFVFVVVVLPASIGVAVLRYRLYDLDLVVSRVAVYGLLVVSVSALYVGLVAGAGLVFPGRVRSNLGATAVVSAVVALAVIPLRDLMRGFVARVVLGHRATPYQVLSNLADHLRSGWTLDAVAPQMAALLADATGATLAVVYVRLTDEFSPAGVAPDPPGAGAPKVEVDAGGEIVVTPPLSLSLVVGVRQGEEVLGAVGLRKDGRSAVTPADRRLVEQLASHAALLFENLRLTASLEHRVEEIADQARALADSRRRLVTAQDDERRRIERDIHDGAQQDLVAMMAKVRLAQNRLHRHGSVPEEDLAELQDDLRRALSELRELAHGIFPPLLADRGLVAAVEARSARFPLPITVDADEGARDGRLALPVAGALYFVASEALANVLKHAEASTVHVCLTTCREEIRVEVADNGKGVGTAKWGTGLTGMSDRLAALGGRLSVSPSAEGGTLVAASVPTSGAS